MLNFFFGGRLTRKQYIIRYVGTIVIAFLVLMAYLQMNYLQYITPDMTGEAIKELVEARGGIWGFTAIFVVTAFLEVSFNVRRIRDIGMSGKWLLIAVAPIFLEAVSEFIGIDMLSSVMTGTTFIIALGLMVIEGKKVSEAGQVNKAVAE